MKVGLRSEIGIDGDKTPLAIDVRVASPHFPGIGRYVRLLVAELVARPDCALDAIVQGDSAFDITFVGTANRLVVDDDPFSVGSQITVARLLDDRGSKLLHTPFYISNYLWSGRQVSTVQDLVPLARCSGLAVTHRFLFRVALVLTLLKVRRVIVPSSSVLSDIGRTFPRWRHKVDKVFDPVDPVFVPIRSRAEAIDEFNLRERGYLLHVGTHKRHKNTSFILRALKTLGSATELMLVLVGPSDEGLALLLAEADLLGLRERVRWIGAIPDQTLATLMSGALGVVVPSLYEGFGLPAAEAMACGCPVLAANRGGLPEVVGEGGLLFDPIKADELAEAIEMLRTDPALRDQLGHEGRKRAALYTPQRCVDSTLEVYRSALNQ